MKTTTKGVITFTAVLTVLALALDSMLFAIIVPVVGVLTIMGLAIYRWRLDVLAVSPREEARAHRRVGVLRRVGV